MALPSPNLDDRRFQQFVDDAKRYVQQRCPEWTDHNVSDPGVTLIEAVAYMADQLVYRLNRVPDKNYLAFLDLLGINRFPPAPARADVTFRLSAPQPNTVLVPVGSQIATLRTESEEALVFSSAEPLRIVPCSLTAVVVQNNGASPTDRTVDVFDGKDVPAFSPAPQPGDALYFGLSAPVPSCLAVLRLSSQVDGVGVDPRQPPLVWEAWNGTDWTRCETYEDGTGGLNRPGDVLLRVPATHVVSTVGGIPAGWLRCRVVAAVEGQPFYSESPTVRVAEAATVGGVLTVQHAETIADTPLGVSEGVPGQRFRVARTPVLTDGDPVVVQVSDGAGWQDWTVVDHFGASGPTDRHVTLDPTTGEFSFPPAVREADGSLRHYGATPAKQARIRVPRYRTGGGRAGNVSRGAISVLRSSIPYVARVENREAAGGGVDGETVEEAKVRAPMQLRVQERAVTAADHEHIARLAAPAAARVHCVPADGGARVLVVPDAVADEGDRYRFEQLVPPDPMLTAIADQLGQRRMLGARILVEPPYYQGVTVVARLVANSPDADRAAVDALYRYLSPLHGGVDGAGWPFGQWLYFGEVFAVLQRVPGVTAVQEVRLFPADPLTGRRGAATDHIELAPHALLFSHQHQVSVS